MKRKSQVSLVALIATSALVLSGCGGSGFYTEVETESACLPVSIEVNTSLPSINTELEIALVYEDGTVVPDSQLPDYRVEYKFGIYGDLGFDDLDPDVYVVEEDGNISGVFPTPAPSTAAFFNFLNEDVDLSGDDLFWESGILNFEYTGKESKTFSSWIFEEAFLEESGIESLITSEYEALLFLTLLSMPSALVAVCVGDDDPTVETVVAVTPLFPNLELEPEPLGVIQGEPDVFEDDRLSLSEIEDLTYLAVMFPNDSAVYATDPATNLWIHFLTNSTLSSEAVTVVRLNDLIGEGTDDETFDLATSNLGENFTVMVFFLTPPNEEPDADNLFNYFQFGSTFYNARVLESGEVYLESKIDVDASGEILVKSEASVPNTSSTGPVILTGPKPNKVTIPNEYLTITGAGLNGVSAVLVNSVPAKIAEKKSNRLSFVAPVGILGEAQVELVYLDKTIKLDKKINFASSATKKNVRLGGLKASKATLGKALKQKIRAAIENNPGAKTITCSGLLTKNTKNQKALAASRAANACAFVSSLDADLVTSLGNQKQVAAGALAKRQVVITIG